MRSCIARVSAFMRPRTPAWLTVGYRLRHSFDGIGKKSEACSVGRAIHVRVPRRMLRRVDESFWMWHETEDAAGFIAGPCHIGIGTVGVRRCAAGVGGIPEHKLACSIELRKLKG